jgi:hypothetical protein
LTKQYGITTKARLALGTFQTFKSFNSFKLFNELISLERLERFEQLELLEPAVRSVLCALWLRLWLDMIHPSERYFTLFDTQLRAGYRRMEEILWQFDSL